MALPRTPTSPGPRAPIAQRPLPRPEVVPFDTSSGPAVVADFAPGLTNRSAPLPVPGGGVLLSGYVGPAHTTFAVGRYLPDGRPDPGFGAGGTSVVPIASTSSLTNNDRMVVQPDGRIVVGKHLPPAGAANHWSLLRLLPAGGLDTSFNGDGKVTASFPEAREFLLLAGVLLCGDGRILLVGSSADSQFFAARFLPNGDLDRSFGIEGKLRTVLPGTNAHLSAAALDQSGRIVVAGSTQRADSGRDMLIARFLPSGTPDQSFGFNGSSIVDFGLGNDTGTRLRLLDDGRILVAGMAARSSESNQPALVVLRPDGTVDASFGAAGLARVETGKEPGSHTVSGLERLADGRLAVAGFYLYTDSEHKDHPLYRIPQPFVTVLHPDGSPDRTLDGNDGVVFLPSSLRAYYVQLTPPTADTLLVLSGSGAVRLLTTAGQNPPPVPPVPPGPIPEITI